MLWVSYPMLCVALWVLHVILDASFLNFFAGSHPCEATCLLHAFCVLHDAETTTKTH